MLIDIFMGISEKKNILNFDYTLIFYMKEEGKYENVLWEST